MVSLKPMTRQMCHEFYKDFQNDPAIGHYYEYVYTPEIADRYFDHNAVSDRKVFAIMVDNQIVGECKLKNIDIEKRECSMGIHLQNDSVKEKGYGTQAERLILQYAFEELGMHAVNADAALKNTRSQHVLEKVGFRYIHEDEAFKYYRCERMRIYQSITSRTPIEKGWSGDQKYCAVTADGSKYLLRISSVDRLERKRREYGKMCEAAQLGIPMCLPIEFGTCEEGAYSIQSWIDGEDAEEKIMDMDSAAQYHYGLDAGRILAKIHTIPAPVDAPSWEERFNAKIDRKIAMYENCELKYENGDAFLEYLAQNRHLLGGRPQSYQHGDYHIGNMMIDNEGKLTIIDFDRDDFGDPWEEFNRIVWCAQAAPAFASGMVDGYFEGEVPMEFWELLALYISSNTLSSLPWAVTFGEAEITTMKKQAAQVLAWYDNMHSCVPTWYGKI